MHTLTIARRALALVAVLSGCTVATKPLEAPAAPADLVTAVRGTLEQWRQAYEVRSPDALAKLYSHEPTLSVVQDGTLWLGWTAFEPVLLDKLKATAIHVRLKDVQISAIGATGAVVVATMLRERVDAATTVTENGVLTLVVRNDGGWVIVAEHYSYKRT
jgi:ketosteroid isomerase-like protein